jgi:hypothetical protein
VEKIIKLDEKAKKELIEACLKDKPLLSKAGNREKAKKAIEELLSSLTDLSLPKEGTIQELVKKGCILLKTPLTKGQEFRTAKEQAVRTLFGLAIKERFYEKIDRFKIVLKE